ncbi:MAG: membrane protein insertion efficiency factor YidD [Christensenellales bacterium]
MKRLLLALLGFYKSAISPHLPSACRFTPTCSIYAQTAISRFGAARGSWLTLKRLLRCQPFCKPGYDPVPQVYPMRKTARSSRTCP